jgi:hypothetical protein
MKTELERLKVLSALKLGYGKLTAKNTTEAEFKNIEDAIEIVKNCSIPDVAGQSEQLKVLFDKYRNETGKLIMDEPTAQRLLKSI